MSAPSSNNPPAQRRMPCDTQLKDRVTFTFPTTNEELDRSFPSWMCQDSSHFDKTKTGAEAQTWVCQCRDHQHTIMIDANTCNYAIVHSTGTVQSIVDGVVFQPWCVETKMIMNDHYRGFRTGTGVTDGNVEDWRRNGHIYRAQMQQFAPTPANAFPNGPDRAEREAMNRPDWPLPGKSKAARGS